MSAEITAHGPRPGVAGLVDRARVFRPLVKAGQLAVTGGYVRGLNRRLAADLAAGPHDFVLELGCGDAPLLGHLQPRRYAGLDINRRSLKAARRKHGGEDREFVEADVLTAPLAHWRDADAVVCSAVFHHLGDQQVLDLVERVFEETRADRIVGTDGVMVGPFRRAIVWLDEGEPIRPKEDLFALLGRRAEVLETWSFDVPFGTVHEFGFELSRG
jgi:SAM-dependent methyltransferase